MSAGDPDGQSYVEVKASIGSTLILSSKLERELRMAIAALGPPDAGTMPRGIGPLLEAWRGLQRPHFDAEAHANLVDRFLVLVNDARNLRNALCHGLVGIEAGSHGTLGCVTVDHAGERRTYTSVEIEAVCRRLDRSSLLIRDFTRAVLATDASAVSHIHTVIRSLWPI